MIRIYKNQNKFFIRLSSPEILVYSWSSWWCGSLHEFHHSTAEIRQLRHEFKFPAKIRMDFSQMPAIRS